MIQAVKPVKIPIQDILDLHNFNPKEIPDLLEEYLYSCRESGIYSVRLIHGKGSGILKERVRSILNKMQGIKSFTDAPPEAGGWGATLVELKK